MAEGLLFVYSGGESALLWHPGTAAPSGLRGRIKFVRECAVLVPQQLLRATLVQGYRCEACRRVEFEYRGDEEVISNPTPEQWDGERGPDHLP